MAGQPPKIKSPTELMALWNEYKAHVDNTPDKDEVVTVKGEIVIRTIKRPYLRQGFQSYVFRTKGFHIHQYIDNYQNAYSEYLGVVTYIRGEWEEDQISGTLTGRYKAPNLTARLNGLVEKTDNKNENTNIEIKAEFGSKAIRSSSESTDNP